MVLVTLILILLCGTSVVPRAEFERTVEQYVRARLAHTATEVAIEFRSVPDEVAVQAGEYTLQISETGGAILSGNVSLPVEVITGDRMERQCIVSIKVRTFDSVLVATRQLDRHEALAPADVRRVRIETTALKGTPLTNDNQLAGQRTKRIINAGSILTEELLSLIPDVIQGSNVTLVVRGKNFRFLVDAVAKSDGTKGEQVTVQRAGSTARVQATVVDRKTVEIEVQ